MLILLFADRRGDLRVVLTIRSAGLKNYAGQAALPGGKADSLQETSFMTARREAFEEIGLPMSDHKLPTGYELEHLTELPANLAMTELCVRPCVAFLKAAPSAANKTPDVARDLLPRLDAKEVAAVFTAPFHNFLREQDEDVEARENVPGEWYKGSWHSWHETAWRMHQFFVPVTPSTVFLAQQTRKRKRRGEVEEQPLPAETAIATPSTPRTTRTVPPPPGTTSNRGNTSAPGKTLLPGKPNQSTLQPPLPRSFYSIAGDALEQPRYRVFGMTARILVDCARVAFGEEPEFEHNSHFGDEDMIARLIKIGRLHPIKKEGDLLTRDVMMKAANAKM